MTFANASLTPTTDGIAYATAKALTGTEVDLANVTALDEPTPVPLPYQAAVAADVVFTVTGTPDATSAYVVMQTDLGDGVWFDVAWALATATSGTASYLLSAGVAGSNAFQQSRASGTAPSSSGSNQCVLGARIRFVGKVTFTNGTSPKATVTVKYKLVPLR